MASKKEGNKMLAIIEFVLNLITTVAGIVIFILAVTTRKKQNVNSMVWYFGAIVMGSLFTIRTIFFIFLYSLFVGEEALPYQMKGLYSAFAGILWVGLAMRNQPKKKGSLT